MAPALSLPRHDSIVLLGPTASGKTRLGVQLALALNGEIVSADSRQVYVGCDIGSGKDRNEYVVDGVTVPCHLIDLVSLTDEYSVFNYQQDFFRVYAEIQAHGALPLVVGGTGLYLDAVLRGYRMVEAPENPALRAELQALGDDALRARLRALKPDQHNTTDLMDRTRLVRAIEIAECEREKTPEATPALNPLILGVRWPRTELRTRIAIRLQQRIEAGLIEEVEWLHKGGIPWERLDRLGLEYRAVGQYLRGEFRSKADFIARLTIDIGQFAKRQETWFRRMERHGHTIHWIDRADINAAHAAIRSAE